MKKLFTILIAIALLFGAEICYAGGPAYDNTVWVGGQGERRSPPCEIVRVRYGLCQKNAGTLASGSIVMWDTTSADGVTVTTCPSTQVYNKVAGVLVTPLLTDDNGTYSESDRSFGYMCVRGYCLCLVDTSVATTGRRLCFTNDGAARGYAGTADLVSGALSSDAGVLLTDGGSDGLMKVYLNN